MALIAAHLNAGHSGGDIVAIGIYSPSSPPSLISLVVYVDVKHHVYSLMRQPDLRSCVKVEVAVLGSLSLLSLMVSVDVKQHWIHKKRQPELSSFVKVEVDIPGSPSPIGACL